jgi:hypothetical protein
MARIHVHHGQARLTATRFARNRVQAMVRDAEAGAKLRASIGPYATGFLARSITSSVFTTAFGVRGRVGSDLSYAEVAERGSPAHIIRPRPPKKAMYFYWRKVDDYVWFSLVRHPGMKGKGYLRESLIQAGRRHGFRVRIRYD